MPSRDVVGRLVIWPDGADDAKLERDVVVNINDEATDKFSEDWKIEFGASDGKTSYYIRVDETELRRALRKIEEARD